MDIGLSEWEFDNMTYGQFSWKAEQHRRKEIKEYSKLRLVLSAQTGEDARNIIPLPGDFDHIEKQLPQEESKRILEKHGLLKVLQDLKKKADNGG